MKTYTVAYTTDSGLLLACVPDNTTDEIYKEIDRVEKEAGIEINRDDVVTEEGLILTNDAPRGLNVRWSTGNAGRLNDETGVEFRYAIKA